ncbi:hypothetical protein ACHAXT_010403 [Thalassiosira profunda]
MPELPEVEHFRHILLPLVARGKRSASSCVALECPPPRPTKRFPSEDVIDAINGGGYVITDALRKGKVLCVVLEKLQGGAKKKGASRRKKPATDASDGNDAGVITGDEPKLYLSLHMGMTGRMSSPTHVPGLESLSEDDAYPPPHTHLILRSNGQEAAFSDPRRFGSVLVDVAAKGEDAIPTFDDIAVDALEASKDQPSAIAEKLVNRKKGIKGLLLDQRAVVSGVGNWVADEIMYRACIHPDQSYLDTGKAKKIVEEMHFVLSTAVECLNSGAGFPEEWLFHQRWRNGGSGGTGKDYNGKTIKFIQSGGRSTAVVPSLQRVQGRSKSAGKAAGAAAKKKPAGKRKTATEGPKEEASAFQTKY